MNQKRAPAFTLIEVSAVLVLIGLMASAAALSLRGAYRGAQMKDVVSRIKTLDRSTRRHAEQSGQPGEICINPTIGKISFTTRNNEHLGLLPVVLPHGYSITDVQVSPSNTVEGGDLRISCTAQGHTPSYALVLNGPNEQTRLMVFAGMSGQITELEHDADFDLDKLLTPRPDTH